MRVAGCFLLAFATAEIQPSFHLEYSAWHATDIVVATEGDKIDGRLTVLESLKGAFRKGDAVELPDLARFAPDAARMIYRRDDPHPGPAHVTGSRMILFMVRQEKGLWKPATFWKEWFVSVLWIEGKEAFGFQQRENPGPSLLFPFPFDEAAVRTHAARAARIAADLDRSAGTADLDQRAAMLKPHLAPDNRYGFGDVVRALEACGSAAVPVLREAVRDDRLWIHQGDLVVSLAQVLGDQRGPEFHRLLEEELAFWKIEAPKLPTAWFDFPQEADERIARHCRRLGKTVECLRGLRTAKVAAARETITALRDLWVDTPALKAAYAGFDTFIQECDATLNALR